MSSNVLVAMKAAAAITTNTAPAPGTFQGYNASAGNLAVTLPALSGVPDGGQVWVEKDLGDQTLNTVTFTCAGSDTMLGGATSKVLSIPGERLKLQRVTVAAVVCWKVLDHSCPPLNSELAFLNNVTGTVTAFAAASNGTAIPGTSITVPISARPVYIDFGAQYIITTGGLGALQINLVEGSTLRASASVRIGDTNKGTGSATADVNGTWRLGSTVAARTFQLYAQLVLDASSTLAANAVNTAAAPSWIAAIAR